MRDELHRRISFRAFKKYLNDELPVQNFKISELGDNGYVPSLPSSYIYILRLDEERHLEFSVRAIPNSNDRKKILYIGGTKKGDRCNLLIGHCRNFCGYYFETGLALNDDGTSGRHPVASCLTTSLLSRGFTIKDCQLDILPPGDDYHEREFLIGYQELFHHLPPWNAVRGGVLGYHQVADTNQKDDTGAG